MLCMADLKFDPATKPAEIVKEFDGAIETLRSKPVDKELLNRARVKLRSDLYDNMGAIGGFGLADLLASFALFDDNPGRINSLESEFEKVTPELIQKTAQEYLRPENRTVLVLETKPATHENSKIVGTNLDSSANSSSAGTKVYAIYKWVSALPVYPDI